MAEHVAGFNTAEGVKKYDFNALANRPTDATNTVISPNADYAEVGEWADGNPSAENRLGYFVAVAEVADNTTKIRKATSEDDVRGVTVYNPAFSGNAAANKYSASGELLQQYNYVGIMGIIPVIDNGRCTVQGRCMPADDGTAIPSTNNMGYAVLERVDATHVLIAVEPGADMAQRIKSDIRDIETQIERLAATPYDKATDGEKLYDVNFGSSNFIHIDDSTEATPNNGTLYNCYGNEIDEAYIAENHRSLSLYPFVSESVSLKMDSVDTNGGTDHRYIGRFPMYDLENKTYTLEFEYFRNFDRRHKIYFASGTFINRETGETMQGCGCDVKLPNLAIQLSKSSSGKVKYTLVRQSMILSSNTENIYNDLTQDFVVNANGEFTAKLKIVLRGYSKKQTTLYANYGEVSNGAVNYWVGEVIPIDFEIYHSVASGDVLISSGSVYQPADVPLVCGVGNYDVLADGEYYGCRNVSIYKGDITKPRESSVCVDLSAYDTDGKIVETYADGSTKTSTIEFDENGNPIKITDSNGHVTEITW